jgi:Ca-activated chloride channel family protein
MSFMPWKIKIKKHLSDLVVAMDMSHSMLANDIYPSRFEFAKNKLYKASRLLVLW